MIRAMLTIARRDLVATVATKGFIVWLLMPLLFLMIGPIAGGAIGASSARETRGAVAVIDPDARLRPFIEAEVERTRTLASYHALRDRFRSLRGDAPLPPELAEPADALSRAEVRALSRPGALERLRERYDLAMPFEEAITGLDRLPRLVFVAADDDPRAQASRLLRVDADGERSRFSGVLLVEGGRERLLVGRGGVDEDGVARLVNDAREARALSGAGGAAVDRARAARGTLATERLVDTTADDARVGRRAIGTGAVFMLFMLIAVMSQILLSNMVEEKSNKVIEVLAASVPVPAIFAGKLLGMLGVSLIGLTVWGSVALGLWAAIGAALPAGLLPSPAVGWPMMALLAVAYFITAYLVYGAVYLGIGSLCSSIREVQTLSMPATIAVTVTLVGTLAAVNDADGLWGTVMSWFPLSSPFMMAARAALEPALGVHALAILWQLAFAGFAVWLSARLFRTGVLMAGPPPSLMGLLKRG